MNRTVLAAILVVSIQLAAQTSASPDASSNPKVRAITAFVRLDKETYRKQAADALVVLRKAKADFESAGYAVETIRVTTQPLGDVSIGAAIEAFTGARFGSSGTLTAARIITAAVKAVPVRQVGYSGLMVPVMEDKVWHNAGSNLRTTSTAFSRTLPYAVPDSIRSHSLSTSVTLQYTEQSLIRGRGMATGRVYVFSGSQPVQTVGFGGFMEPAVVQPRLTRVP